MFHKIRFFYRDQENAVYWESETDIIKYKYIFKDREKWSYFKLKEIMTLQGQ